VNATAFFKAVLGAPDYAEAQSILDAFLVEHGSTVRWDPVGGRDNNRGVIEVSGDPGRAIVERLTNGIDAVLEDEHESHGGKPDCRSPQEAAMTWLNVPPRGLGGLSPVQRRALAQRVTVAVLPGGGIQSRTVDVRDYGTGISAADMPRTILSLNESNKWTKHYLVGTYGQGGSSTLAVSRLSLVAARTERDQSVGFTVIRYEDLDPELFKTGRYVYLTIGNSVLAAEITREEFKTGTLVRHFGYDLTGYPSPLGPNSVYGMLNGVLFDPVLPIWLDDQCHEYRRVIKGSRNALNGAVDEGDASPRQPSLSHSTSLFYVDLGDIGRIGIEYWLLAPSDEKNKRPSAAFINPTHPIVLTLHGQAHGDMSGLVIRKRAELPYLSQRLICHINCDHLSHGAKRALFVSTREDARKGVLRDTLENELVRALKSDDKLVELNSEARLGIDKARDESANAYMRREVAKLLTLQGLSVVDISGGGESTSTGGEKGERPVRGRRSRPKPAPIPVQEPPTFINIVWEDEEPITLYPGQRRYIRIQTDANSTYHDAEAPSRSKINIITSAAGVSLRGSTPLSEGHMRFVIESATDATPGSRGLVRVELSRPNLPMLSDEKRLLIVPTPPISPRRQQLTLPPFQVVGICPEDGMWSTLGWPDEVERIASTSTMDSGTLMVYYNNQYPRFAAQRDKLERRDTSVAASFTSRYEIWLAMHALLMQESEEKNVAVGVDSADTGERKSSDSDEVRDQAERCRVATLAAVIAAREVTTPHGEEE
jgi:hypothetical protein